MYIVGLTGQIAAGKSTLGEILKKKGAVLIDADETGHELLETPEVRNKIKASFGAEVFEDNRINRAKLADISFQTPEKLQVLNKIMWPLITAQIKKQLELFSKTLPANSVIVVEAPLMLEAGLNKYVKTLVAVISSPQKQLERLSAKGYSAQESKKRMASQTPQETLIKESDYIFTNNDNIIVLEKEAEKLWHYIKKQEIY